MPRSVWEDEVTMITHATQTDSPTSTEAVVRRAILRRVLPLLLVLILIIAACVIPPFVILFARKPNTTTTITTEAAAAAAPTNLPVGTIILFSGDLSALNESTDEWLLCDGSEVSRLTYQELFAVIGITYGVGNRIDTFNLPDFTDRFPLGSNASGARSMVAGGASTHILTIAELPAHTHDQGTLVTEVSGDHNHTYTDPGHNHGGSTGYETPFSGGSYDLSSNSGSGGVGEGHSHSIETDTTDITIESDGSHTHIVEGLTGSEGFGQAIDIMPPYQTIHYIILA